MVSAFCACNYFANDFADTPTISIRSDFYQSQRFSFPAGAQSPPRALQKPSRSTFTTLVSSGTAADAAQIRSGAPCN
jgi:hypothetical protein